MTQVFPWVLRMSFKYLFLLLQVRAGWAMSKRNHPCLPHRVYTEWQQPLFGIQYIPSWWLGCGGAHPPPFHYIYHHVQSYSVRSSWEGRHIPTFPLFHLNPYVLCGPSRRLTFSFRSKVIKGLSRLFKDPDSKGYYIQSSNFKLLRGPRIDSMQGTNSTKLCSLAGRCDNPIPTPTPRRLCKYSSTVGTGAEGGGYAKS